MIDHVIKEIRKEHNLTQKDLADLLYVSDKTVSSWENHRTVPDIYTLERISTIFGIPMNDLMQGDMGQFSKLKYRFKQTINRWLLWIRPHTKIVLWAFILLIGYGLTLLKWPMFTLLLLYVYMGIVILRLSIKTTKWHSIGTFTWLSIVVPNGVALINPALYGSWIEANTHHWIQAIWIYGFLISLLLYMIYMAYQSFKAKRLSLLQINVILTQVGLWAMVYFSYKIVKLNMVFSTWTQAWEAKLVQQSHGHIYSAIFFVAIGSILVIEQYIKGDSH